MKRSWHPLFAGAALAAALVASGRATADFKHRFSALQPVACAALAADLTDNPVVKSEHEVNGHRDFTGTGVNWFECLNIDPRHGPPW